MAEQMNYKWFLDFLTPDECHMHGVKSILFAKQTKFQALEIMDTGNNGLCLVLDGKMQSAEKDEFIYHEGLVHPIMLAHPAPKNVMIIGGGEGATLREVLRYPSVENVLMVDIDQEVVEACKKYLPTWHQGAFDDPRVRLKFIDARKYLEETKDIYDIIIIDISEPMEEGPAYLLYTKEFYQIVTERLTPEGMISLQAGTTAEKAIQCFASVYQTLVSVFPIVQPYQSIVPSFGLPWGLILASKKHDPNTLTKEDVDQLIPQRVKGELRFYDGEAHLGQFFLPKFVRRALTKESRLIEDNHPIFMYT